jgi:DNA methylase
MKRKRHQDGDKITQVSLSGAPSLPYSSPRPVRPPRGRLRSALSQLTCALACAHAHETPIWASRSKGARHTFSYAPISSLDPTVQVSFDRRIPTGPKVERLHGYHPTQKPLRFVRRVVFASMEEGNLALDPYNDSGTTAVAKELNRAFIAAELEEELAKLAARWIAATQQGSLLSETSEQPWSNA